MSKKTIFISYTSTDLDKVEILENLIKNSKYFDPLIIADQRKALKPLAQKVIDGIKSADIIVPILTQDSIKEQWINQEIGYATSEKKTIIPVVQSEIIDKLKGFIHKEIDLPYTYKRGTKIIYSTTGFTKACELLITDLESEFGGINDNPKRLDSSIEKAIHLKKLKDLKEKKQQLINSPETLNQYRRIVRQDIIEGVKQKIRVIQKTTGIPFKIELNSEGELAIIISAEGFSSSIYWTCPNGNTIEGAFLFVIFWQGVMVFKINNLPPSEKKQIIKRGENKYFASINDNLQPTWTNSTEFTSGQIIESAIGWILRSIEKKLK